MIFATVGTHAQPFARFLAALADLDEDVVVQYGHNDPPAGVREAVAFMPFDVLNGHMREADVVVTHAGVGSALAAMRTGKRAIYVPRRRRHGEHVDDHQVAVARELDARGLVLAREADAVTAADLASAAGWEVRSRRAVAPFRLGGDRVTGEVLESHEYGLSRPIG